MGQQGMKEKLKWGLSERSPQLLFFHWTHSESFRADTPRTPETQLWWDHLFKYVCVGGRWSRGILTGLGWHQRDWMTVLNRLHIGQGKPRPFGYWHSARPLQLTFAAPYVILLLMRRKSIPPHSQSFVCAQSVSCSQAGEATASNGGLRG